jgi:hypothetical protein
MFREIKIKTAAQEIIIKALEYSIENYQERLDTTTFQRGIIYYLVHNIDDIYSNLGLSLMNGIQKIFKNNWSELT